VKQGPVKFGGNGYLYVSRSGDLHAG